MTSTENSIYYIDIFGEIQQNYFASKNWLNLNLTTSSQGEKNFRPIVGDSMTAWSNGLCYRDQDCNIIHMNYSDSESRWVKSIIVKNSSPNSPYYCCAISSWEKNLCYVNKKGEICHAEFENNQWKITNLSNEIGSSSKVKHDVLTCWKDNIIYFDDNGVIHHLSKNSTTWVDKEIDNNDSYLAVRALTSWENNICFIDKKGDIILKEQKENKWKTTNLTEIVKVNKADVNSSITSSNGSVCFIDSKGHIQQIYSFGDKWKLENLSVNSDAPPVFLNSSLASWKNSVAYIDRAGNIQLLSYQNNGWVCENTTQFTKSPKAYVRHLSKISTLNVTKEHIDVTINSLKDKQFFKNEIDQELQLKLKNSAYSFINSESVKYITLPKLNTRGMSIQGVDCAISIGSVVVDVISLALSFSGMYVRIDENATRAVSSSVKDIVELSQLKKMCNEIISAESKVEKAMAIFKMIKELFTSFSGLLLAIIKKLFIHLPWYEFAVAIISFMAQIAAFVATSGVLFVAELVNVSASLLSTVFDCRRAIDKCSGTTSVTISTL